MSRQIFEVDEVIWRITVDENVVYRSTLYSLWCTCFLINYFLDTTLIGHYLGNCHVPAEPHVS